MGTRKGKDAAADAVQARNGIVTLKPIGVTEDGAYVTLARRSNAKSGGWRIAVDDDLLTFLERAVARTHPPPPLYAEPEPEPPLISMSEPEPEPIDEALGAHRSHREDSKLSPKEIQALLRQGKSVSFIARKAGVSTEWVERFEVPIIWERAGMALRARRATMIRSRQGAAAAPLEESVRANLRSRRARVSDEDFEDGWDAVRHARTGNWIVKFSYINRNRQHTAQWEFDPEIAELRPIDKLASELGWSMPSRRKKVS